MAIGYFSSSCYKACYGGLIFYTVITMGSILGTTIWGSILKFGRDGMIASDDCLGSSGIFMLVWLIIAYVGVYFSGVVTGGLILILLEWGDDE